MTIDSSPALVVPVATGMKRKLPETKKETAALSSHYSTVIVDIEGTTTPISFVKDVLFPFIPENIHDFLTRNWDSSDSQAAVKALQAQSELDNKKEANKEEDDEIKVEVAPRIPQIDINSKETLISAICANVAWQMARDRKITALKAFQGLMWAEAYKRGDVKGAVFEDVVPALEKWSLSSNKKSIYVYSSGSVDAQILLFKYSEKGDLTRYFNGNFDTTIGLKTEASSYSSIAKQLNISDPSQILFISDNIKEIQAALQAGFQCAVASRPGNAPLPDSCIVNIDDRQFFQTDIDGDYVVLVHIIKSFDELFDLFDQGGGEVEEKREKKFKVVESSDSNLIQHD